MERVMDFVSDNWKVVGIGLCGVGATVFVLRRLRNRMKKRVCGVDYPRDVVMMHQYAKGAYAPSLSHFVMKLEMYLRVAKIPYQNVYDKKRGPKNKIPWIEYNGVTIGDSQLIMHYLNKELKVNLNKDLDPYQRAQAWAIQKWLEEFTYYLNMQIRVIFFEDTMSNFTTHSPLLLRILIPLFRKEVKRMLYTVGVGRHSEEEIFDMMTFDLQQLSTILGDKKFLMGDKPTEVDCAAFGILSQIRWHTPDKCPGKTLMKDKLTNLMAYTDRIKELYWPDWDEMTVKSSERP